MTVKILLSGFGGQGILAMGKMYAQAASDSNRNVTSMPFYEGSMRGGAANTYLIVSEDRIRCPVISCGTADMVVAMYQRAANEYGDFALPSGLVLVNTDLVDELPETRGAKLVRVPVNTIAAGLKNERSANIVMLGAMAACSDAVSAEAIKNVIRAKFAQKHPEHLESNLAAFDAGYACAKEELVG